MSAVEIRVTHPGCADTRCKRKILPGQLVMLVPADGPGGVFAFAHVEHVGTEYRASHPDRRVKFAESMNWLNDGYDRAADPTREIRERYRAEFRRRVANIPAAVTEADAQ